MRIKLFAMDVDGTMTDGKIYMGQQGEMMKAFNIKDGYGIRLLRENGVVTAMITARQSQIAENRAKELGIDEVVQGAAEKAEALSALCAKYHIAAENAAFIGDDLNDLQAMAFAGLSLCPSDAVSAVREAADVVLTASGGNGAIREAAERILRSC